MDKEINANNKWLEALTKGRVEMDKSEPKKKIYKSHQVSNRQRRGVTHGN